MELKRVVITGIGTINPLGNNINEYFDNLIKGVNGIKLITGFDAKLFKTRFAGEVKLDVSQYTHIFDRKEARKLDQYAQFAVIAAEEAFRDSKLDLEKLDLDMAGVIVTSGIGGIKTFFDEVKAYVEGGCIPRFSPFFVPKMIADIAAGHISMRYGFRGPNYATVAACASSTQALIDSFNWIRLGKATIMIAGGAEAAVNEAGMGGFNAMQAMSTNNDNFETASRPFDSTRDGFVMGEGAGILILEEYEHAVARGAKIYAEFMGGGMTADAYHITAPHPEGLGAANVMKTALEDGGVKPEEVDYVNVHGTATPRGDVAELKAIEKVFGDHGFEMNISSTKSMTGHLLGAAGAIEALACICAMERGQIPPTINHVNADPDIDPRFNLTLNKTQKRDVKVALSNTFGFGGHNASVVFKKI